MKIGEVSGLSPPPAHLTLINSNMIAQLEGHQFVAQVQELSPLARS